MAMPIVESESAEQIAVLDWWGWQYRGRDKLLFAIPNGGLRNKTTAARLKREGVKSGVADLFLAIPYGGYHGAFIEMKRAKGGQQSREQKIFQEAVEEQGYLYILAHGSGEAITKIEEYLRGEIRAIPKWRRERGAKQEPPKKRDILPDKDYLSIREAGELLNISRPTILSLIKEGTIEAYKTSSVWLIHKKTLADYVNSVSGNTRRKPGRKKQCPQD